MKKYKIIIALGQESCNAIEKTNEHTLETIINDHKYVSDSDEFDTLAEVEAFRKGCETIDGWEHYLFNVFETSTL